MYTSALISFVMLLVFTQTEGKKNKNNCDFTPSAEFLSNSRIDYVSVETDVVLEVQIFNSNKLNNNNNKKKKNNKAPLLFIHGYLDSRFSFLSTIECLDIKNRAILVPSLRGFGDSQVYPYGSQFNIESFVNDLKFILDYYNINNAIWIGHSMGTLISLYAAANENNILNVNGESYVKSLILIGAGNRIPSYICDDFLIPILENTTCPDRDFIAAFQDADGLANTFSKDLANQVLRESFKVDIEPYVVAGFEICDYVADSFLDSITQDTTIIWGSNDIIFPLEIQNELQNLLINANVDFIQFDGIGHNTQWEIPDQVAQAIDDKI